MLSDLTMLGCGRLKKIESQHSSTPKDRHWCLQRAATKKMKLIWEVSFSPAHLLLNKEVFAQLWRNKMSVAKLTTRKKGNLDKRPHEDIFQTNNTRAKLVTGTVQELLCWVILSLFKDKDAAPDFPCPASGRHSHGQWGTQHSNQAGMHLRGNWFWFFVSIILLPLLHFRFTVPVWKDTQQCDGEKISFRTTNDAKSEIDLPQFVKTLNFYADVML